METMYKWHEQLAEFFQIIHSAILADCKRLHDGMSRWFPSPWKNVCKSRNCDQEDKNQLSPIFLTTTGFLLISPYISQNHRLWFDLFAPMNLNLNIHRHKWLSISYHKFERIHTQNIHTMSEHNSYWFFKILFRRNVQTFLNLNIHFRLSELRQFLFRFFVHAARSFQKQQFQLLGGIEFLFGCWQQQSHQPMLLTVL